MTAGYLPSKQADGLEMLTDFFNVCGSEMLTRLQNQGWRGYQPGDKVINIVGLIMPEEINNNC